MSDDYGTQAVLAEATSELKSAIQKYHQAVNQAEGKPGLTSYPIEKFLVISCATVPAGTLYHMAHSFQMSHHEIVGLAEVLREKVS